MCLLSLIKVYKKRSGWIDILNVIHPTGRLLYVLYVKNKNLTFNPTKIYFSKFDHVFIFLPQAMNVFFKRGKNPRAVKT